MPSDTDLRAIGPAAKCGCISVGDSLVGVNGMEFEPGTPHGDVMKAIAEA